MCPVPRYDWEGHDLGTYLCKKPAKKPNDLFVTTPEYLLRVDLRSALPLESPQTLRLAENNRTLDLPLAVGSRKPLPGSMGRPLGTVESCEPIVAMVLELVKVCAKQQSNRGANGEKNARERAERGRPGVGGCMGE